MITKRWYLIIQSNYIFLSFEKNNILIYKPNKVKIKTKKKVLKNVLNHKLRNFTIVYFKPNIGTLSVFLEVQTALIAGFYGVIHAMKEAQMMGLTNVWLECDFVLVCVVFTARTNVPWMLRNRWNICLNHCEKIRFKVTHNFREGNAYANKLANLGFIHRESFHWYNRLSSSLFLKFFINKYSLLLYRFC